MMFVIVTYLATTGTLLYLWAIFCCCIYWTISVSKFKSWKNLKNLKKRKSLIQLKCVKDQEGHRSCIYGFSDHWYKRSDSLDPLLCPAARCPSGSAVGSPGTSRLVVSWRLQINGWTTLWKMHSLCNMMRVLSCWGERGQITVWSELTSQSQLIVTRTETYLTPVVPDASAVYSWMCMCREFLQSSEIIISFKKNQQF